MGIRYGLCLTGRKVKEREELEVAGEWGRGLLRDAFDVGRGIEVGRQSSSSSLVREAVTPGKGAHWRIFQSEDFPKGEGSSKLGRCLLGTGQAGGGHCGVFLGFLCD